jgi:hypothetical protein
VCYPLDEILLLCLLAVLAGAECFTEIALFGVKKRIKGLCGAKPPQKPRWTDAVGFGGSMIRYGDFTTDARSRGELVRLSRRLRRVATASSPVWTTVSG